MEIFQNYQEFGSFCCFYILIFAREAAPPIESLTFPDLAALRTLLFFVRT